LRVWEPMRLCTRFTIPKDAKPEDYFNLILEVQDDAKKPITRYAQVIVTVNEPENDAQDQRIKNNKQNLFESLLDSSK
jgi:hypothetical protein